MVPCASDAGRYWGDSTFRAGVEVHGIAMVAYLKHLFRLSHGNAGTMSRFQIDRG